MSKLLRELRHWAAHKLHWQLGTVVSATVNGRIWIGFQCSTCGAVTGAHIADV
jgi:hypothetical protein